MAEIAASLRAHISNEIQLLVADENITPGVIDRIEVDRELDRVRIVYRLLWADTIVEGVRARPLREAVKQMPADQLPGQTDPSKVVFPMYRPALAISVLGTKPAHHVLREGESHADPQESRHAVH